MGRRALSLLTMLATMALARTAVAGYAVEASRVDWYLVISDTHIGTSGDRDSENLAWATREAYTAIQPSLVVNCGDLTDATGLLPIPTGPQEEEWQEYRAILDDGGMTADLYVDLPGNHDQYEDAGLPHYLEYSISGSADGQTQHSVRQEGPSGVVHLLMTATPASNGGGVLADNATLDAGELAFLQKSLDDNADADVHLVFGHHPVDRDIGNSIEGGKEEFKTLLKTFDATAYVYGHTHSYQSEFRDRTLHLNLDSLGKSDKDHVALLALDDGSLSVRTFAAAQWPYVVITAPVDVGLGGGNPRAYSVPPGWDACPVRALVFGDRAPDGVRFQVDGGPWIAMTEATTHVWTGTFDSTGMGAGHHSLRVQASPWNRNDHEIAFRVGATACSNGADDDFDGLTDWPEDPGCASPGGDDEAGKPPPDPDDPVPADEASAELAVAEEDPKDVPPEEATAAEAGDDPGTTFPDALPADAWDAPERDATPQEEGASPDAPESCQPGEKRCEGNSVVICGDDGRTWTVLVACAREGLACERARCVGEYTSGGCSAGGPGASPLAGFALDRKSGV